MFLTYYLNPSKRGQCLMSMPAGLAHLLLLFFCHLLTIIIYDQIDDLSNFRHNSLLVTCKKTIQITS